MPSALKPFQQTVCDGIVERLRAVRSRYVALPASAPEADRDRIRRHDGAVVLQAPTGSGKTLLAIEVLAQLAREERVLWFWFAPFGGLVDQARGVLVAQAPQLKVLDLVVDRRLEAVSAGGVFVTTWQSVAAKNQDARKARTGGDAGLAVDDLIALARADGVRIGCVVDEAHHGFHKAAEARRFYTDVLRPDYALMMTATPRDADARAFERDTGYRIGEPEDWASVSREDAVQAGLLKHGVKLVRFVARDDNLAELIDFEQTALQHGTAMHRRIGERLREAGIGLTPLMLVQVPDGEAAQKAAREFLTGKLGFAESAVRIHTAKEPDPDLIALAQDPTVEVLVFKMAVALGFDAPRAFTLVALRGARDPSFGVQVIGRIVRVHSALQGRAGLAPELNYGYVFLANSEAQEGLLQAGAQINALTTHSPEIGPQTVVTVSGSQHAVQIVRTGETAALMLGGPEGSATGAAQGSNSPGYAAFGGALGATLAADLFGAGAADAANAGTSAIVTALAQDAATACVYSRRPDVPARLVSEWLPPASHGIEQRVVDYVDFSPGVLGAMQQSLARVLRVETELFAGVKEDAQTDALAQLSPERMAQRVEQQLELFAELDRRALFTALTLRFRTKLVDAGIPVPDDEEAVDAALDLVLARHPRLLREANRFARMSQVSEREVELPALLTSSYSLPRSIRNAYGVLPAGLNNDERAIAQMLDDSELVLWWHRNPSQTAHSLALYRWDDGAAFYPDFVVACCGRGSQDQIALLEPKGPQFWGKPSEVAKANGAAHSKYGRCVFVGRETGKPFRLLRATGGRLVDFADFEVSQLRSEGL